MCLKTPYRIHTVYCSSHHFCRNYNKGLPGKLKSTYFRHTFFVRPSLATSSVKILYSCNKSSKNISINCDFLHFILREHNFLSCFYMRFNETLAFIYREIKNF